MKLGDISTLAVTAGWAASAQCAEVDHPEVQLNYTTYKGFHEEEWGLNIWKGIRYAQPPIEGLRWRKPVAPEPDAETTNAIDQPPMCIQFGSAAKDKEEDKKKKKITEDESEDCLFLNVYAPDNADKLPVFVWIHGGEYNRLGANADPRRLMKTNDNSFIFVDIQYRLGVFGFMTMSHYDVEEEEGGHINVGLHDQRFALQWVQDHIAKFGGDPEKVTLGGSGSGAASAIFQALANEGEDVGLFHNILADSPFFPPVHAFDYRERVVKRDGFQFFPLIEDTIRKSKNMKKSPKTFAEEVYERFKKEAGCKKADEPIPCLRKKNTKKLHEAAEKVTQNLGHLGKFAFIPVKESKGLVGYVPKVGKHRGLIRHWPTEHFANGTLAGKKLLIGTHLNDGLPLTADQEIGNSEGKFAKFYNSLFDHEWNKGFNDEDWKKIWSFYGSQDEHGRLIEFHNTNSVAADGPDAQVHQILGNDKNVMQLMANRIIGEAFYQCPAQWIADTYSSTGRTTWKYMYSNEPNFHGADLLAVFPDSRHGRDLKKSPSVSMMVALQRIWGQFIINSDPVISVEEATALESEAKVPISDRDKTMIEWTPYKEAHPHMLVLDSIGGEVKIQEVDDDYWYYSRDGDDVVNSFSLVSSWDWDNEIGKRCKWWKDNAKKVPY